MEIFDLATIEKKRQEGAAYLEKLQKNRSKAAKAKKPYWQKRIDDYMLKGVMK
jgi:hypothetical protein